MSVAQALAVRWPLLLSRTQHAAKPVTTGVVPVATDQPSKGAAPALRSTESKDRTRVEGTDALRDRFRLIQPLLDAGFDQRIERFRRTGHALEIAELPAVLEALNGLNPAQLNQVRDALIRLPTPSAHYKAIREREGDKGVASVEQILSILSGEAAGIRTIPRTVQALGRAIIQKQGELGRAEIDRIFEPHSPARAARVAELSADLELLEEVRKAVAEMPVVKGKDAAGLVLGLSLKMGIPGIVSFTLERTAKVSPVDPKTGKREKKYYSSFAVKGPAYFEVVKRDKEKKPDVSYGASLGWAIFAKNHPVYGDRAGVWIPLVGEAEFGSKGLVGGMLVTPSWLMPVLHLGWKCYVEHPALAQVTIPAFNAVDRSATAVASMFKKTPAEPT